MRVNRDEAYARSREAVSLSEGVLTKSTVPFCAAAECARNAPVSFAEKETRAGENESRRMST